MFVKSKGALSSAPFRVYWYILDILVFYKVLNFFIHSFLIYSCPIDVG